MVFAYAHGPALAGKPFHDLDIVVYLDAVDEGCVSKREIALTAEAQDALSRAPNLPSHPLVDLRALNSAPLGFCTRCCCVVGC